MSPDRKLHPWVYEELIYPFQHHKNTTQNATHTSNHDKKNGNPLNLNQLVSEPTPGTPISINKYNYCPVFSNSNYRYIAHPIKKTITQVQLSSPEHQQHKNTINVKYICFPKENLFSETVRCDLQATKFTKVYKRLGELHVGLLGLIFFYTAQKNL